MQCVWHRWGNRNILKDILCFLKGAVFPVTYQQSLKHVYKSPLADAVVLWSSAVFLHSFPARRIVFDGRSTTVQPSFKRGCTTALAIGTRKEGYRFSVWEHVNLQVPGQYGYAGSCNPTIIAIAKIKTKTKNLETGPRPVQENKSITGESGFPGKAGPFLDCRFVSLLLAFCFFLLDFSEIRIAEGNMAINANTVKRIRWIRQYMNVHIGKCLEERQDGRRQ